MNEQRTMNGLNGMLKCLGFGCFVEYVQMIISVEGIVVAVPMTMTMDMNVNMNVNVSIGYDIEFNIV